MASYNKYAYVLCVYEVWAAPAGGQFQILDPTSQPITAQPCDWNTWFLYTCACTCTYVQLLLSAAAGCVCDSAAIYAATTALEHFCLTK